MDNLEEKYKLLAPHLDERTRRLVAAADAISLGHGGVTHVSAASGLSRVAITHGKKELENTEETSGSPSGGRIRKKGGGRKKLTQTQEGIEAALEKLVAPHTLGDPESPLLWTSKSLRKLSLELANQGFNVSHVTVGTLLEELGYSLQSNQKTLEGKGHPDRDAQFQYINEQSLGFLGQGLPVISVDTKKKELVGRFKNGGQEWRPEKHPEQVNTYDFLSQAEGKAIPYGVYDVGQNQGWVNVGLDHDTPKFAMESIRGWWKTMGQPLYQHSGELLICADGGGSNSSRSRVWKKELQAFANETGMTITVCHFPPGTSKWNKIEHRMFSQISINWRGKPLTSYETIISLIQATTTQKGLKIKANLDKSLYEKGEKVSDEEMSKLNLQRHLFHGDWNYTISPQV